MVTRQYLSNILENQQTENLHRNLEHKRLLGVTTCLLESLVQLYYLDIDIKVEQPNNYKSLEELKQICQDQIILGHIFQNRMVEIETEQEFVIFQASSIFKNHYRILDMFNSISEQLILNKLNWNFKTQDFEELN